MSIEQRDIFIKHIFTAVAPYVDVLSSAFSLGLDLLWRKKTVALSGIRPGERVLDVCTGTGKLAFPLARAVGPQGFVTGVDFCEGMLMRARGKAGDNHSNLAFEAGDAKRLAFPDGSFDAVTVAFGMRNIPDTLQALSEIRRVLRQGGTFICLELTIPQNRLVQALYRWYVFRIMPVIGRLVVKTATPYLYLPRSIQAFYQPDEFRQVIAGSGFTGVTVHSLSLGVATIYRAVKDG